MNKISLIFGILLLSYNTFSTTFYVNDNSQTFDIYCSAVGNNLNTGLTPADPFETLNKAISVASAGDIIYVDAGNYSDINISLSTSLNNLSIIGASINTTVFDGSLGSGVFNFMNISGSNITIENLSIQFYDNAGAIDIISGSSTDSTYINFSNCYFDRNETFGFFDSNPHGGAIYISTGSGNVPSVVSISNCQFSDNLAEQGNGGGAIYADGRSRLDIYGSRFVCNNSRAILTTYEGGAIMFNSAYGQLDSCFISGSPVFDQQGGGFRAINGTGRLNIRILNTIFTDNTGRQGAAFYIENNYDCYVINSLIYGNTVTGGFGNGGSISTAGAVNMSITNSTIADNLSTHSSDGGGLAIDGATTFTVLNSIIWNNQVSNVQSSTITATYSCIEPVNTLHSGTTGNISLNPLFNGASDYSLQNTSPCIDAGNLSGSPTTDLTNNLRSGNPDMGAFEITSTSPSTSTNCALFLICSNPSVLALTVDDANLCSGNSTNITIDNSESGVIYQLVNDNTAANVGSPQTGNGGTLSFPTGTLSSTTDFSILAFQSSNPSCNSNLGPITVSIVSDPSLTISSTDVCIDGSITLSPNSGGTWISNNPSVATVTSGGMVSLLTIGTVDFTFTESIANCQSTTSLLTVNDLPTVTVSSNSICEDGSLTLTPISGGTWASNNNAVATVSGSTVSIVGPGSVDFTFTESVNNCSANTSSVIVNASPSVTVSSNSICLNSNLVLTPNTGGTWISNNTSVATVSGSAVTILSTGFVDFTFTETSSGCSATTSSVTVNNDITTTVANNGAICEGNTLSLTSSTAGLTYSWSGPNGFTSTSQNPIVSLTANNAMSGNYILTISNGNCTNSASTNVTVNVNPSIDISSVLSTNPSACGALDGSITGISATGTPVLTFSWNGSLASTSPDLLNVNAGSYSLVVTDGNGCSSSEGPFVLSDPSSPAQPTITLNPSAVCLGGEFTITVDSPDPTATYNWNGPNGFSANGTSINLTNISVNDAGNYTVTPTVAGCTGSTSAPANVVVNNLPIVDVLTPGDITCLISTITLDGSNSESGAAINYDWITTNGNFVGATNLNTVDVDLDGDYRLIVTNTTTGCVDSLDVTVNIDTISPLANSGGDLISTCSSNSLPIILDGSNSSAGINISYSWVASNGGNIISGGTSDSPTVDMAGTYELTVTDASNGCSAINSMDLTMDTIPPIASDANNNMTTIMCSTFFALNLDGSASSSGNGETYLWTTTNGNIDFQSGTSATVIAAGDYTLTVTGNNGCEDMITITVAMDTISPIINIIDPDSLSCVATTVNIDASNSTGSNLTYFWSTGESSSVITVDSIGTYFLTVGSDNGCSSSTSINIVESGNPTASFTSSVDSGQVVLDVDFNNLSSGTSLSYSWDFGDGSTSNLESPSHSFSTSGEFVVELIVTNGFGCTDTTSTTITVTDDNPIVIPNIFTPNGDGENDLFAIIGNFKDMHIVIYNRWGQVMADLWGSKVKWDGRTTAGLEVPEGTYYYLIDIINFNDDKFEYTGPLLLTR